MLVDADNLDAGRLRIVAAVLAREGGQGRPPGQHIRLVVAGHPARLAQVAWPAEALVLPATGWQRADTLLAQAYVLDGAPLVLVSGDGDFALLAQRHPGPVLVVGTAGATSGRLRHRSGAAVVDPVHDGVERLQSWLSPTQPPS